MPTQLLTTAGPGRPKGSKNKRTMVKEEAAAVVKAHLERLGLKAVDVLAAAMAGDDRATAVRAAQLVLERIVPSLRAIEHSGEGAAPPVLTIDMRSASVIARHASSGATPPPQAPAARPSTVPTATTSRTTRAGSMSSALTP